MAYTWTNDPIQSSDEVDDTHINELRDNINNERSRRGLSDTVWGDSTINSDDDVDNSHIEEIRDSIDEANGTTGCPSHFISYQTNHNVGQDSGFQSTVLFSHFY